MTRLIILALPLLLLAAPSFSPAAEQSANSSQTLIKGSAQATNYPPVTIYTLATCPHCREAKEYFTANGIPFTNKDVGQDETSMEEAMKIFDSMGVPNERRGVPLIIIGDTRLQGFKKELVEKALKKHSPKKK